MAGAFAMGRSPPELPVPAIPPPTATGHPPHPTIPRQKRGGGRSYPANASSRSEGRARTSSTASGTPCRSCFTTSGVQSLTSPPVAWPAAIAAATRSLQERIPRAASWSLAAARSAVSRAWALSRFRRPFKAWKRRSQLCYVCAHSHCPSVFSLFTMQCCVCVCVEAWNRPSKCWSSAA